MTTVLRASSTEPPGRKMRENRYLSFAGIVCFLMAIGTVFRLNLIGTLMLSDLLALLLLPLMFIFGRFNWRQPFLRLLWIMLGVWLLGAVLSDFVNDSPLNNTLRGWAKIIFLGVDLTVIMVMLNGKRERFTMLLLGLGLVLPLNGLIGFNDDYSSGPFFGTAWKFGNGFGLTVLAALAGMRLSHGKGLPLIGMAVLSLALNARSLFLISFVAGMLSLISLRIADARQRIVLALLVMLTAVVLLPLVMAGYGNLASSGALGEAQRDKYLSQTSGDASLLEGGRPEMLVSLTAAMDAPVFGHGSWASDIEYRVLLFAKLEQLGLSVHWETLFDTDLIPSHSHVMGAMVEHGPMGAAFWVAIYLLTLRALYLGTFGVLAATPVEFLLFINTLWVIPFSPFGLASRVTMAINIAVICNFLWRSQQQKLRQMRPLEANPT